MWARPDGRLERWAGWSGKAHAAESRCHPTPVRVRRNAKRAADYLGLRTQRRCFGNCSPTLSGSPANGLRSAHSSWAGYEARGTGLLAALRPLNYNSQQAVRGGEGRPGPEPASEPSPAPLLALGPAPGLSPWDDPLPVPTCRVCDGFGVEHLLGP